MPIFNINGTSAFLFNNTFDSLTQSQFNFSSIYFESGTTLISGATTNQNPSNKRTTELNSGTYELGRIVYHSAPSPWGIFRTGYVRQEVSPIMIRGQQIMLLG